jgi:hypothetical protein
VPESSLERRADASASRRPAFTERAELSPSLALALQSSSGNAAVGRLMRGRTPGTADAGGRPAVLARSPGPTPLRQLVRGAPKINGNPGGGPVKAEPQGEEIYFQAPPMGLTAEVVIDTAKMEDGEHVEVGFIQQVTKFDRTKLYMRPPRGPGGAPSIMRDTAGGGGVRDVSKKKAAEPWYEPPVQATKGPGTTTVRPSLWDQPDMAAPRKLREAKLVGARGADVFDVSLAIKRGAEIVHLDTYHWQVPWDIDVQADGTGKGNPLSFSEEGSVPTALSGVTGNEALKANRFLAYDSVEDAKEGLRALGITEFIRQMPRAAAAEAESYWYMVTAVWQMNVGFVVEVEPVGRRTARTVTVAARGDMSSSRQVELGEGEEKDSAVFFLKEVVDPGGLSTPKPINVEADGESFAVPWPWGGAEETVSRNYKLRPRLSFGGE